MLLPPIKGMSMTQNEYARIACRVFDTTPDLVTEEQVRATKRGVFYALYGGGPSKYNLPVPVGLFVDPTGYLKRLQDAARALSEGAVLSELVDLEITPEAVLAIAGVDKLPLPDLRQLVKGL
jgi:hypothetical protein